MVATIENGQLVLRMPLEKNPAPSKSGKTLVVASTHGNQKTTCMVNGKPITVGLNAYIQNPKAD